MVVGFTTTYAVSAHHHSSCEFEPRSWQGVLDTTLCEKVCLRVFRYSLPIKHDLTEILLKVALKHQKIKSNQIYLHKGKGATLKYTFVPKTYN